ncbi:MAG: BatA domain-containing protein [Planctomycetota bacterium]
MLVNISLLLGMLGIGVPIVLHLTTRRQPQRQVFPAIRFLKARQQTNQRKLQWRQWLLLALRCLVIATLALALARPSTMAAAVGAWSVVGIAGFALLVLLLVTIAAAVQRRGTALVGGLAAATVLLLIATLWLLLQTSRNGVPRLMGDQEAPVAAAIVLDSAPRMDYRFENRTRLEVAQETALSLLKQLPEGSEVAVVDTRPGAPIFAVDRAAAAQAISRLQTGGANESLPAVLSRVIPWIKASTPVRREIYLLTDLSQGAWPVAAAAETQRLLDESSDTLIQVIDVGVNEPRNAGISELELSTEALPRGGELTVSAAIESWNQAGTRTIELLLEEPDERLPMLRDGKLVRPASVPRGRQDVELQPGAAQRVEFRVRPNTTGTQHGVLRLRGEDGLAIDDERFFTIEAAEPTRVLVVAAPGVVTRYFVEAIAPESFRESGQARFICQEVSQSSVDEQALRGFGVVCLLDPLPLPPDSWRRLWEYVRDGGALAIFLGHQAEANGSFHDPLAQQLLGGKLTRQWRSSSGDLFLAPQQFTHPVTREFRGLATSIPWDQFPIYRHWELDSDGASVPPQVILTYSNQRPALLETQVGRGRAITMTTPVSDPVRPRGRPSWNELPTAPEAWPFVMLMDQLLDYLAGERLAKLNYRAAEPVTLPNPEPPFPSRYQLFAPSEESQQVAARGGRVMLRSTEEAGHYYLRGLGAVGVTRGFSVNLDPAATNLTRLPREKLDEILGANRYRLAVTRDDINREIGEARVGREFLPLLLVVVAGVLGLEHVLANRFYGPSP